MIAAYDITDDTEKAATTKLFVRPWVRARLSLTAFRNHVSHGSTTDEDRENRRLLSLNDAWSRMMQIGVDKTALARFELDCCFTKAPEIFLRIKRQGYKSHCFTLFTGCLITSLEERCEAYTSAAWDRGRPEHRPIRGRTFCRPLPSKQDPRSTPTHRSYTVHDGHPGAHDRTRLL